MDTRTVSQTTIDRRNLMQGAALSAAATALPAVAQASENRIQPLLDEWLRINAIPQDGTDEMLDECGDRQFNLVCKAVDIEPRTLEELRSQVELTIIHGHGDLGNEDVVRDTLRHALAFLGGAAS